MVLHTLWNFIPLEEAGWLPVGTGTAVGCLVLLGALYFSRRNRISFLDVLLLRRSGRRSGALPEEDVPEGVVTPEALKYLKTPGEDLAYLNTGPERRTDVRHWGNPVEVRILSVEQVIPVRGVVINRSTGGLAILVDDTYEVGALLKVRAVQTPQGVSWIDVEVRNCRAVGKNWVIGCKYSETPPWNAVVWLG
jgi:hypothetical protein